MAMAQPLWNNQKKNRLLFEPVLHGGKAAVTSKTGTNFLKPEEAHGNDSKTCVGIDMNGNVRKLCKQGRLKEALGILNVMDQLGIRPDSVTYASLIQGCLNAKSLTEGKHVHAHMINTRFNPDIYLGTKLVIMYAKCAGLVIARRVFDSMPKRNVVSWTAMMAAYSRHGQDKEALALFHQMQRAGIQPDQFALASVLQACAGLGALEHGKEVHKDIICRGFQSNVFLQNTLVDMYSKCGKPEDACQVFDKMHERDVVSWTAVIAGCAQNGHVDESLKLFKKMPLQDAISWNAITAGCAQNGHFDEALKLFQKMPKRNVVSWNTMIAGYAQNGYVDEALKLFWKMPKRDMASWNSMIAGYAQNGYFDKALKLFREMQLTNLKPNLVTFTSVLPTCANLAALEHGKHVHEDIIKSGIQSDIFVENALVDMYAKCGSIEDARQVFDKMTKQDVVSWNAMLVGYAMHGCGREALQLFEQMQHSGTKPNHVTFVAILSACCHAGLVNDGWQYFYRMIQDYHITPALEHYCCMVDLLGRCGLLNEAQNFINKMPVKPNVAVWGSLLGACRIHSNIELGEHVAEQLVELDPENGAHYLLLSNIYAGAGRWDDVERVRKTMKDRRVKRLPGCSWIEVNNAVHTFLAGDR